MSSTSLLVSAVCVWRPRVCCAVLWLWLWLWLCCAGSDLLLESRHWTSAVVGKLSPWLRMDSPCPTVRMNSVKVGTAW